MLAIRLQRRGRKGHAQYRVVVQDKDLTPTSGRVVCNLGPFNPHTKEANIDKEKAKFYLDNGAQPSNRVAILLKKEGVKLPDWVNIDLTPSKSLKNPEKLRKNQPEEEEAPVEEAPADDTEKTEEAEEKPAEEAEAKEEAPAEDSKEEAEEKSE